MTDPAIRSDSMPHVPGSHSDIVADLRSAMVEDSGDPAPAPVTDPVTDPEPAPVREPVPDPAPAEPTQPPSSEPAAGPARDDKGRFAKPGESPAPAAAPDPTDPAAPTEPATPPQPDPEIGPLEPPAHWSLDQQKLFREQPEPVQKWMAERDREQARAFTEKTEALAEQRRRYESLDQVIAPREQAIKLQGMSVPQYVDHLLALSDFANQDPAGFVAWFSKERGIDQGTLPGGQPAPVPADGADPAADIAPEIRQALTAQVAPLVAPLIKQIKSLEGQIQQITTADTQLRAGQGQQTVEQFRAATDEAGAPKHPYFAEVREVMADLIEKGRAADMESAYDMAVYAMPETRAKLEAAREAAAARKRQEEARAKAAAAQSAGSSVTGTPAGHGERQPADSVLEEVRRAAYGHA